MPTIPHETTINIIGHSATGIPCSALVDTGADRSSLRVNKCVLNEKNATVSYVMRGCNTTFTQPIQDTITTKTSTGTEQRPVVNVLVKYDENSKPVSLQCSLTESDMKHDMVLGVDFLTETGLTVDVSEETVETTHQDTVTEDNEMSIVDMIGYEEFEANEEPESSDVERADCLPDTMCTVDRDAAIDEIVELLTANPSITFGDIIRRLRTKITESIQ